MKLLKRYNALFIIALIIGFSSCDEYKTIDYSKLLAEENELLHNFLTEMVHYGGSNGEEMARLDSLTKAAIDTVDNYTNSGGTIYFEHKVGDGEAVESGRAIGYRYRSFAILDSSGFARIRYAGGNYEDLEPAFAIAGQTDASSGYYSGINEAIMRMNRFGKSSVIVPSSVGNGSYITYIYDLELVYIAK